MTSRWTDRPNNRRAQSMPPWKSRLPNVLRNTTGVITATRRRRALQRRQSTRRPINEGRACADVAAALAAAANIGIAGRHDWRAAVPAAAVTPPHHFDQPAPMPAAIIGSPTPYAGPAAFSSLCAQRAGARHPVVGLRGAPEAAGRVRTGGAAGSISSQPHYFALPALRLPGRGWRRDRDVHARLLDLHQPAQSRVR